MSLGSPQATLSSPSLSTSHEGCLEGCSEEAIVKGEEGETEGAVSGSSPLLLLDHPAALELIHLLAPAIPHIPVRPTRRMGEFFSFCQRENEFQWRNRLKAPRPVSGVQGLRSDPLVRFLALPLTS